MPSKFFAKSVCFIFTLFFIAFTNIGCIELLIEILAHNNHHQTPAHHLHHQGHQEEHKHGEEQDSHSHGFECCKLYLANGFSVSESLRQVQDEGALQNPASLILLLQAFYRTVSMATPATGPPKGLVSDLLHSLSLAPNAPPALAF